MKFCLKSTRNLIKNNDANFLTGVSKLEEKKAVFLGSLFEQKKIMIFFI